MKASDIRPLGRAGIDLTALGMGSAPLGGLYASVPEADARAALAAAWDAGIRYFDTAPMYGLGRAERLVGDLLRQKGGAGAARMSTKVGRLMMNGRPGRPLPETGPRNAFDSGWHDGLPFTEAFDYSHDAVMRSFDDSQQRAGRARFDLLYVHDIGRATHGERHDRHWAALTRGGGFKALAELRSAGLIAGFGLGVNETEAIAAAMEEADLDCCLLAGRYTLLDRSGEALLDRAAARGVDIVAAGAFNSGILVPGGPDGAKFNYADAPPERVAEAKRLETLCGDFGVPLPAAALQFPLRHRAVRAVVIGAKTGDQVRSNVAWFEQSIPDALWAALDA